jgi:hypothetical protein
MKKKSVKMRKDVLARKFAKLHKVDKEIKALDVHLRKKGFRPQKEKKNFWGIKSTYEDKDKKANFSVMVQDFTKPKSKDGAAVGQLTVKAGVRSEVYSFYLIAPKGDVKQTKEYRVDKNLKVLEADSWWSCVEATLNKHADVTVLGCLTTCGLAAIAGGPFSWAVFLGCLAICAGLIFLWVCACCDCNCNWWCNWIGCCRQ